jgi:hypothetical protein
MPNLLRQPYVAGVQAQVDMLLKDPAWERDHRERFGRDVIHELRLANTLCIPASRWPVTGWVLVRAAEYQQVNTYATNFQLLIEDVQTKTATTFSNLSIVQAQCVSTGLPGDPEAIYLVELTDARGILHNRWFRFPTSSQYNIAAPAYPGLFYSGTLNAGVAFDWTGIVGDLWTQMGAFLGAYPGLPIVPAVPTEGWSFPGAGAWEVLNNILDHIGCVVTADLTKAAPYSIVLDGAADAAFTALQARYRGALEDDLQWLDTGSGRVPRQVIVYFHRRNQYYGTEETVRRDSLQWQTTPLYWVTVAAPAQFSKAAGIGFLWSDFHVRFDVDGNPLAADVASAATIAAERATQFYNHIYSGTTGYLWQLYTGVLPFVTGSLVDGVRYRMDRRRRGGWVTEVIRGNTPPWPEVYVRGHQLH